jgi:hypothetical protein
MGNLLKAGRYFSLVGQLRSFVLEVPMLDAVGRVASTYECGFDPLAFRFGQQHLGYKD